MRSEREIMILRYIEEHDFLSTEEAALLCQHFPSAWLEKLSSIGIQNSCVIITGELDFSICIGR